MLAPTLERTKINSDLSLTCPRELWGAFQNQAGKDSLSLLLGDGDEGALFYPVRNQFGWRRRDRLGGLGLSPPHTSPFSVFCHSPKGALQPVTQRDPTWMESRACGSWLVCFREQSKKAEENTEIVSHEQNQRKGRRKENGDGRSVSCRGLNALFMFSTSDFPSRGGVLCEGH